MYSEEVQWLTIDRFIHLMSEYEASVDDINKWIADGYLTLRNRGGIQVANDSKMKLLIYRLKKGTLRTIGSHYRTGVYIKTLNKNDIHRDGERYHVYDYNNTRSTHRSLDAATKYADEHDIFVSHSRDSVGIRVSKKDIGKIEKALRAVNYQGKISNKLNKAKKIYNERNNNKQRDSVNCNSDTNNSNVGGLVESKLQREASDLNSNMATNNSRGNTDMKRKKSREVKFSKETRKYIAEKYNLSSSRLTYLFCYTSKDNMEALRLIKEAGDYQRDVVDKRREQIESEMYVKPTNLS